MSGEETKSDMAEFWMRQGAMEAQGERLLAAGWPSHLVKALHDPFQYAASVRGLGVVEFAEAYEDAPGWVRLEQIGNGTTRGDGGTPPLGYLFDRGVCVRVADILWVADAPNGS